MINYQHRFFNTANNRPYTFQYFEFSVFIFFYILGVRSISVVLLWAEFERAESFWAEKNWAE